LTSLAVTQSPYRFVDVAAPPASQRFYRVAALETNSSAPSGMALIPAGSFTMGDTLDGESDAIPMKSWRRFGSKDTDEDNEGPGA